jgi:hypothetical protein
VYFNLIVSGKLRINIRPFGKTQYFTSPSLDYRKWRQEEGSRKGVLCKLRFLNL